MDFKRKGLALKRAEEISLPFLSCRDFSLRASSLSLCSPSDGKCGEKITAGHPQPVRAPAGRTDPNRPTICKSFRSVYIPSSRYIGNYWCLRFGANVYAKKRKLTILNFEKFLHGQIVIQLTVDYKFVRTGTLLCDKNISSTLPYCVVLFLTKNKLASTINNFLGW